MPLCVLPVGQQIFLTALVPHVPLASTRVVALLHVPLQSPLALLTKSKYVLRDVQLASMLREVFAIIAQRVPTALCRVNQAVHHVRREPIRSQLALRAVTAVPLANTSQARVHGALQVAAAV